MSPVKRMNRWAARVPIWLAAVLLAVPMVTLARWGFQEVNRADSAHGGNVDTSEAPADAEANAARAPPELARATMALAPDSTPPKRA